MRLIERPFKQIGQCIFGIIGQVSSAGAGKIFVGNDRGHLLPGIVNPGKPFFAVLFIYEQRPVE